MKFLAYISKSLGKGRILQTGNFMTTDHQDTKDYVIIADEKRRDLFGHIQHGDECLTAGEWMSALNRESFSSIPYRRHRSRAWLRIADKPVEFPCWIKHKDDEDIRWFDKNIWNGDCPFNYGFTHWQPADPAPDAPINPDEEAFEKMQKELFVFAQTSSDTQRFIWQAGRDYEKQKGLK